MKAATKLQNHDTKSPIDAYLDDLNRQLPAHAQEWRLLVEARDHLIEKADAYEKQGLKREVAEKKAVRDFGSAQNIVASSVSGLVKSGELFKELIRGSWLVAALLFIAVGLSGLLANAFVAIWGQAFVAGDAPGVTYTAERCADYFRLVPNAANCTAAAVTHHYGEIVDGRVALGIVGLIGLIMWYLFVRKIMTPRLPGVVWLAVLLAPCAMLAAAGMFLGAMPLFFGFSKANGAGAMLSLGVVFAIVSLIAVRIFWKQSRQFVAQAR